MCVNASELHVIKHVLFPKSHSPERQNALYMLTH